MERFLFLIALLDRILWEMTVLDLKLVLTHRDTLHDETVVVTSSDTFSTFKLSIVSDESQRLSPVAPFTVT